MGLKCLAILGIMVIIFVICTLQCLVSLLGVTEHLFEPLEVFMTSDVIKYLVDRFREYRVNGFEHFFKVILLDSLPLSILIFLSFIVFPIFVPVLGLFLSISILTDSDHCIFNLVILLNHHHHIVNSDDLSFTERFVNHGAA